MKLTEVRKALVASIPVVLAAAKVLSDALGNGSVTAVTWSSAGIAALTAIAVYSVPNAGKPRVVEISDKLPPLPPLLMPKLDDPGRIKPVSKPGPNGPTTVGGLPPVTKKPRAKAPKEWD